MTSHEVTVTPTVSGAHLVGSINQPDAESTFRIVSKHLGDRLSRIPDGEIGERFYWIQFQRERLASVTGLESVGDDTGFRLRDRFDVRLLRLSDGVSAEDLVMPSLGYADAALDSYAVFRRLRDEGTIREGTRFQVSLPTPTAVVAVYIAAEDRAAVEPVYQRALFAELDRILAWVPHEDFAIQWDSAVEFALLESDRLAGTVTMTPWFEDVLGGVIERAARQAAAVPADVQVGYHLCYGDVEEAHFVQPRDTGNLASVISGVLAAAPRPITWFHLPVPIERDDEAYFAPLADVALPADTELYLGLVHHEDGVEGARRRIRAASTAQPRFGVATECGFGRGPADRTAALLDLHADVARPR